MKVSDLFEVQASVKIKTPAYLRKAKAKPGENWKISDKDLTDAEAENISGKEGLKRHAEKVLGTSDEKAKK